MDHKGTVTLETEHLILRRFTLRDADAMFRNLYSDAEAIRYLPWDTHANIAETEAHLTGYITEYKHKDYYAWAIVLKGPNEPIGFISAAVDETINAVKVDYGVGKLWWHKGYTSNALSELIRFSFEEVQANRVYATHDPRNPNSGKVMEKCGMIYEGTLRQARHRKGEYSDRAMYAILKEDWNTKKEIMYYDELPCHFQDFIEVPTLSNGEIYLVCVEKQPGSQEKKLVPGYEFAVCKNGERIGRINLRIGYCDKLYYGGQIGYDINEAHRGNDYAGQACRLLLPVAKAHKMEKLLITNDIDNTASKRVCEKLGARLVRVARLPEWHDLYIRGGRFSNIYEWNVL